MSEIANETITNTNIKFRYGELYASDAANTQAGVNTPGAYRGAIVTASGGTSIKIETEDGETVVVHRDASTGFATVVRVTNNISIDLSSSLPTAGSDNWYVYLDVDYQLNDTTTGSWVVVDDVGDIPTDAVRLATIELTGVVSVINQEDIRTDGTNRDKVINKRGILVPKLLQVSSGGPGRVRFQIEDRVSYLGEIGDDDNRVRLCQTGGNYMDPLVGSEGGEIKASAWYDAEVGGSSLSYSDMDEDGCYEDPWVSINFGDTVDTDYDSAFQAAYWAYVPFDDIDVTEAYPGFLGVHANNVECKAITDSPDSTVKGDLGSVLEIIVGLVNDRVKTIHDDSVSMTWVLLWRSNNKTDDSTVDNDTISIYFSSEGLLYAKGVYISVIGTHTDAVANEAGSVMVLYMDDDSTRRRQKNINGGESFPFYMGIEAEADWDIYNRTVGNQTVIDNIDHEYQYEEWAKVLMEATPNVGGRNSKIQILDLDSHIRVYYEGYNDGAWLHLCSGCSWDEGDGLWRSVSSTPKNAHMISVGRDGISFSSKDQNDADWLSGWSSWTSYWSFGGTSAPMDVMEVLGDVYEEHVVEFKYVLSDYYIAELVSPSYTGPTVYVPVNYRSKRLTTPEASNVTYGHKSGETLSDMTCSGRGHWGMLVSARLPILSHVQAMTINYMTAPYTIVVNDYPEIAIGQTIVVRGSTVNEYWTVSDVSWSVTPNTTTITVYNNPDRDSVPNWSTGDEVAYCIAADERGKELSSFYYVRLYE